jgi:hypothetical protein
LTDQACRVALASEAELLAAHAVAGVWPTLLAGIRGQRTFVGVSPQRFRRGVLNLLILIAGLSMLRAMAALLG